MSGKTVFLSHRRDERGKALAHTLREALTPNGYDVFLDVNEMEAGPWPAQLLREVSDRAHFLLLITPGTLERCADPDDWVRKEFEQAERTGRNIVPIFGEGVDPGMERELCPDEMRHLFDLQGTRVAFDTLQTDLAVLIDRYIPPHKAPAGLTGKVGQRHNLPGPSIDTRFKGRDQQLEELHAALCESSGHAVSIVAAQAIHGLGGVGKTRLAIEYGWRHLDDYSMVLFVRADSAASLDAGLAGLASLFGLPETTDQPAQVQAVKAWLNNPIFPATSTGEPEDRPPWLLILDNVDDEPAAMAANSLVAALNRGHVLITARWATFGASVRMLELDVLDEDAAVAYLLEVTGERRQRKDSDETDVRDVARRLEYLAVALEQAAAYIYRHRVSFADYLAQWDRNLAVVSDWHDELRMDYPNSVAATWVTTVDRLSDEARSLLDTLSWLASDPLPASVFADQRSDLVELSDYSMLKWDSTTDRVQMHRLVQEITRSQISADECVSSFEVGAEFVVAWLWAEPEYDLRSWPMWDLARPHINRLIEHAERLCEFGSATGLMSYMGCQFRARALPGMAESLDRRGLNIVESTHGPDSLLAANWLSDLSETLAATSRRDEAELLLRRAADIAVHSDEADDSNAAARLSRFAISLHANRRLPEAIQLARHVLAVGENTLGADHATVAIRLDNLSTLLVDVGQLAAAECLTRRALLTLGNSEETKEQDFAISLDNLGAILRKTGRRYIAEALTRSALQIGEKRLGPEHPEVAVWANSLSVLLQDSNRLHEAEVLSRRALEILVLFGKVNGYEHSHLHAAKKMYTAIRGDLRASRSNTKKRLEAIAAVDGVLEPIVPVVDRLLGAVRPLDDVLAELDEQYRAEGRSEIYFLKPNEPIAPHLDQLLGPAQSVEEVLQALDERYRKEGRPDVWFLPIDEPISPHLDELLGPIKSDGADAQAE